MLLILRRVIAFVVLLSPCLALAAEPLFVWQRTIVDNQGNVVPNASVTVQEQVSGSLASLFDDFDGADPAGNPIAADSSGFVRFYAVAGRYRITASSGGFSQEWQNERLGLKASELRYDISAAEISAGVTPVDYSYRHGDVRRYGAILDGSADDTDAVQDWFDVGGELFGHPGTARVTAQLEVTEDGTIIDGRGMEIEHDTDTIESVLLLDDNRQHVTIQNIEIDGQKSQKSAVGVAVAYCIEMQGTKNVRILNNYVHDCYEHGIRAGSIDNGDTSVETNYLLISGNYVFNNGNAANVRGAGIWLFGLVRRAVVTDNFVFGNMLSGINVDDTSSGGATNRDSFWVAISNNFVHPGAAAGTTTGGCIGAGGTRGLTITGNICIDYPRGISITAVQSTTESGSSVISGNRVNAKEFGIRLVDAEMVTVTGNVIKVLDTTNDERGGIEMYSNADDVLQQILVSENLIYSATWGIRHGQNASHNGTSENITIRDNDLYFVGTASDTDEKGIWVGNATGASIRGNRVFDFYHGIYTGTVAVQIADNDVYDSAQWGIRIAGASLVKGNYTSGSVTAGLRVESAANDYDTLIRFNEITDGTDGDLSDTTREFNYGMTGTSTSAANIASVSATINTVGKYAGKLVFDTTNNRLMRASGSAAADPWHVVDGSVTVTPS